MVTSEREYAMRERDYIKPRRKHRPTIREMEHFESTEGTEHERRAITT